MATKNDPRQFQFFLKISLVIIVEILDLALRAVIDSFKIYTIHSLIKKKIESNFITFKASFAVVRRKQNRKILLLLQKVLRNLNHILNKISSFFSWRFYRSRNLAMKNRGLSLYLKKIIAKVKILNKGSCLKDDILLKK